MSPLGLIEVDLKVKLGWFSRSRKSADFKWPSRMSLFVVIEAAFTVASTEEVSALSPTVTVPVYSVNSPRTLAATKWRTLKPTCE